MLMLASSHALTSRMTPELGLTGRGGGCGDGEARSMWIGIGGVGVAAITSGAALVDGAVRGRIELICVCIPSTVSLLLRTGRDAVFRNCRCSHFFAVSCLLSCAGKVFLVVMVGMLDCY